MAEVLNWRTMEPRDAIRRAVDVVGRGGLVAFPTETVYGIAASPLQPAAIERLVHCKGRPDGKPLTLALRSPAETADWAPGLSKVARRLARRCWPGPLTMVLEQGASDGLLSRLAPDVRQRIAPAGSVGLRVPAHAAILQTLALLAGPLALTSANRSGEPDAVTGAEVIQRLGDELDLIIDDGAARYGQASTVVRIDAAGLQVLREGVLPASLLQQLTQCLVVFVCTGNTCRSPLAEGLCRKLLAERLGCAPGELAQRGFIVLSSGVSAMIGEAATAEATAAARSRGVDLDGHASQPLTAQLLAQADHVFAMTRSHLRAVVERFGHPPGRLDLLAPDGVDIQDPIGGEQEVYEQCADEIARCLEARVAMFET